MTSTGLEVFFRPRGIAVIGASRDPLKLGNSVLKNLIEHGYTGPVYPINPVTEFDILGLPVYAGVDNVPDPLEMAVIALPAPQVPGQLELCGRRGIKAVIIVSGGFRETGEDGAAREAKMLRIAQRYGMRVVGPNCVGVMDTHLPLNATFVIGMPAPGEIAFVSQSGAMVAAVLDWARGAQIGFSRVASLGNQTDVTEAEMIGAVAQDGYTRVITTYIEGVSNGRVFLDTVRQASRKVPVIALKGGRSQAGAQAVASHTGSLAGMHEAFDAACRRAGVIRADSMEQLFDWGRVVAWQPLPKGDRVAVLTNAGGPGVIAMDVLEDAGMQRAPLTEATKAYLRERVPPAASVNNPVDILAGSGAATYALCMDALLRDETVDAVITICAPQAWFEPVTLAEVVAESARGTKPVLAVLMGLTTGQDATDVLNRRHIPNFAFPERACRALAAAWERQQWLQAVDEAEEPDLVVGCDLEAARAIVAAVPPEGGWLPPEAADSLLAAYGIPTPGSGLAADVDEALALANEIGYPVVLKLAAAEVVHKSEVGGVALNIDGPDALRDEFERLMDRARAHLSAEAIEGVFVQQMIPRGVDLIVGMVRDPQFGPLIMAGIGGVQVELLRSVAFELAPLNGVLADDLLERSRAGALLAGFRGAPPADRDAVIDVIVRLARLASDHPCIAEIEINPLMALDDGDGAWAVDARARIAPTDGC